MSDQPKNHRRKFLKKASGTAALALGSPSVFAGTIKGAKSSAYLELFQRKPIASNDNIRIAVIGTGGMGIGDVNTALMVDGVEIVAACDLYDGRLTRAKELWGADIFTTKDYREILERADVDAVINATTDHWHQKISLDAMDKGKHVYCEKPMVQRSADGHEIIAKQKSTGLVFQVGSQYVSSIIHAKAKELLAAGEIGEINFAEAQIDRHSARGAWQYTVPLDASTDTVDWDTYISNAPKREWDPLRFFRWRNYQDYGTGVAGDLYVHMLSMLHFVTGSKGPERVQATGGLRYWKDGRDVPDIHLGLFDYPKTNAHPAFNLSLRTNLVSGGGNNFLFRIVGSEGDITIDFNGLKLRKTPFPKDPGMSLNSFPEAMQEALKAAHREKYPQKAEMVGPKEFEFKVPSNYKGDRYEHFVNFFESIRNGKPVVEDAVFGLRASGPTEAGNISYFEKKIVGWDPIGMKLKNL
ncbi:Gfo/Idh/MocA family oxidoreductase [Cyclobacterium sp. 1_MG-2023]|uniref:Gfo/Idh/MocA family protein n=1 Tax=Cyclobacterium sp. 1_MG-2023 TaxID=3062681 RepID=UPI0026E392E4|nr:Gfo/Idh/MocA family oxidoreductase [Cyclobacterium sp. 1_MG-2023]MDO6439300.1 Gfo/Idh/MocA family oxidoreductase [Cyclobacterium sp. 1_MG-2023]